MARRPSRRRLRRIARFFLVVLVSFVAWRLLGATTATIREGAVSPLFENGDVVVLRPARRSVERGSIVAVRNPFPGDVAPLADGIERIRGGAQRRDAVPLHDRDVLRVVAALPGDRVTWDHAYIVVRTSEGGLYRLSGGAVHDAVEYEQRHTTVPEGHIFLIALDSGRIDSRIAGPEKLGKLESKRRFFPTGRVGRRARFAAFRTSLAA
ncbi:MAG: S26 family signal peptidase, partial [Spirochaetales bacterium]|nr:S26 family signal peptidase [Spirochaetales bacterium]